MNAFIIRISITGIFLIISIISGIWLSKMGRPLKGFIFSVHKIISLLGLIAVGLTIYRLKQVSEINQREICLILLTGLSLLISLISGALLSFDKLVNNLLLFIHKVSPILIIVLALLTIYYLKK